MNWQSIIADLKQRGVNQEQVAAICRCSQSSISYLANKPEAQPNFSLGQALVRLHGSKKRELDRLLASIEAKVA